MPLAPPLRMANRVSVRVLNEGWFRVSSHGTLVPLATYFHPLDGIGGWNVLYGPDGFVQYQFAVPPERGDVVEDAVEAIAASGIPAFLAVLKRFGPGTPGPLSFAQSGWTLALDFPVGPTGLSTLLDSLDETRRRRRRTDLPRQGRAAPARPRAASCTRVWPRWPTSAGASTPRASSPPTSRCGSGFERPIRPPRARAVSIASRRARAATIGSAASVRKRTTTKWRTPAAANSGMRLGRDAAGDEHGHR